MKLRNKKMTTLLFGTMLVLSMAFTAIGCGGDNQAKKNELSTEQQSTQTADLHNTKEQDGVSQETESSDVVQVTLLGEGEHRFLFTVVDQDGNETNFEIHTDKEVVGEALLELGLIAGEEGSYGLYVKTVNGITADYDADQTYWAFYINDEYAMTGVDATPVEEGAVYTFKVEK